VIGLVRWYESVRLWTFTVIAASWTGTLKALMIVTVVDRNNRVGRRSVGG